MPLGTLWLVPTAAMSVITEPRQKGLWHKTLSTTQPAEFESRAVTPYRVHAYHLVSQGKEAAGLKNLPLTLGLSIPCSPVLFHHAIRTLLRMHRSSVGVDVFVDPKSSIPPMVFV